MDLVAFTSDQVLFNFSSPSDTSSGTLTLTVPATSASTGGTLPPPTAGDIAIVAVQGQMKYISPGISASDGWSSGKTTGGLLDLEQTYYQVLSGSGPWSITLTGRYASAIQAILIVVRGVNTLAYGADLVTSDPTHVVSPALPSVTPETDTIIQAFAGLGSAYTAVSDTRLGHVATITQITQHVDISAPSGYYNQTQLLQVRYWVDVPSGTTIGENTITTNGVAQPGVLPGVVGFTMRLKYVTPTTATPPDQWHLWIID